jgi:hypothetical protein
MYVIIVALFLAIPGLSGSAQMGGSPGVRAEGHIKQIIEGLPRDSLLRRELTAGARGTGVRFAWMDELRERGVKRVLIGVDITFDRRGRPKQMKVESARYFTHYEGDEQILDPERLNAIRASGLEKELDNLALGKAAHGHWLDVPRPMPNPFVGGAQIQFLDDEWLPSPPTLYAVSNR